MGGPQRLFLHRQRRAQQRLGLGKPPLRLKIGPKIAEGDRAVGMIGTLRCLPDLECAAVQRFGVGKAMLVGQNRCQCVIGSGDLGMAGRQGFLPNGQRTAV